MSDPLGEIQVLALSGLTDRLFPADARSQGVNRGWRSLTCFNRSSNPFPSSSPLSTFRSYRAWRSSCSKGPLPVLS